jgi:ABC-type spermidine/putrescine transport system permease subunit I
MKTIDYNKMAHYTNSLQPNFMGAILRSLWLCFLVVAGCFEG